MGLLTGLRKLTESNPEAEEAKIKRLEEEKARIIAEADRVTRLKKAEAELEEEQRKLKELKYGKMFNLLR